MSCRLKCWYLEHTDEGYGGGGGGGGDEDEECVIMMVFCIVKGAVVRI
jgi:hypothetical protein